MRFWLDSLYTRLALVLVLALVIGFTTMALLFRTHINDSRRSGIARGLAHEIRLVEELRGKLTTDQLRSLRGLQLASSPESQKNGLGNVLVQKLLRQDLSESLARDVEVVESATPGGGFWVKLAGSEAEPLWLFLPGFIEPRPAAALGPNEARTGSNPVRSGPKHELDAERSRVFQPRIASGVFHENGRFDPRREDLGPPSGMRPHPTFSPGLGVPPPPPGGLFTDSRWLGFWAAFGVVLLGGMLLLWQVQVPLRRLVEAMQHVGSARAPLELNHRGPREVKTLVEQFNLMVQRLRRSDEERNIMLAGIAHDLRSPLTRLRLQLELALDQSPRYPAVVRNFESIDIIIDQFLLFARGGEGEPLEPRSIALFVAEVAAEYEERGVILDADVDVDLLIDIRPGALRRAIQNLLDNAFEYGQPPILLRCTRSANEVLIQIIDHGVGIPDLQREQALQPFSRLDEARSGRGHCGLGLAIVERVIAGHGGQFSLQAVSPSGLMAQISLPIVR